MNTSFVKSEVKASPSRSPHLREYKTVLDSGFYALDSAFQSPGSPIPPSKFQDSGFRIWIPLHGTSLGLQANPFNCCASFSSRRWGRITQEYSQIISTSSRWVKKVELYYTSMLTCISQDGIDHMYRQRIQPFNTALPQLEFTADASESVLWGMSLD